jgi:phosphoribosyl-dephospho-CoA transferase
MTKAESQFRIASADAVHPHDLLLISGAAALNAECALPQWVEDALAVRPVVVVRRALGSGDGIPVGVRGSSRAERFAALVSPGAVRQRVAPEELAQAMGWRKNLRSEFAAIRESLELIATRWRSLAWGPAGSVGFELATGARVTTCESDLDLVIRAPQRMTKKDAEALLRSAAGLAVRADVRIETPFGSIALQEYASPPGSQILMKTCAGPRWASDPWRGPGSFDPSVPSCEDARICLSRADQGVN